MLANKSILAVIPARGGSKGIKLKNIQKINGVPLIAFLYPLITKLKFIDSTIVSTDSEKIANVARNAGLSVPFMRPKKLSGDSVADLFVLRHALKKMEKIDKRTYDIILMLQPTSPLRKAKHIKDTVNKLIEGKYDSVMTVTETDSKEHPLKQLIIKGDELNNYDKTDQIIITRQQLSKVYHRNGVAYSFTRDCLMNQNPITNLGEKASAIIISDPVVNIDTHLDLQLAEFYISKGM